MKRMTVFNKIKDPERLWVKIQRAFAKGDLRKANKFYEQYEEEVLTKEQRDSKARNVFMCFREKFNSDNMTDYYDKAVGRGN
jgi:hypothetical protein